MSVPSHNMCAAQLNLSSGENEPQIRSTLTNVSITGYGPHQNPHSGFIDIQNADQNTDSLVSYYGPNTAEVAQDLGITQYSSLRTDQSGSQPLCSSETESSSLDTSRSSLQGPLPQTDTGKNDIPSCTEYSDSCATAGGSGSYLQTSEEMNMTSARSQTTHLHDTKAPPDCPAYKEISTPRSPPPAYSPRETPQRMELPANQRAIEITGPGININIRNSNTVQVGNNNVLRVYQTPHRGNIVRGGHQTGQKPEEKKKVTLEVPKRIISEADMDVVVTHLGREWRVLGTKLHISAADLDAVEYDNRHHGLRETTRQMLRTWVEHQAINATLKNLSSALIAMKRADIVKKFATEKT